MRLTLVRASQSVGQAQSKPRTEPHYLLKEMEETPCSTFLDGEIIGIRFALAGRQEITSASINDFPISHASQLSNPFLGLPLEFGKCESCGTSEAGKCEGHFGYVELPIPIFHPSHISELRKLLSLVCLNCLQMKNNKFANKKVGLAERMFSCCEGISTISVREAKTKDGVQYLLLRGPSRSRLKHGFWNFMKTYGFSYGNGSIRTLLPSEAKEILRRIPVETRKKLSSKGYFPQDGYILQHLPVPPNCLSVPEISDGVTIMSTDPSITMLKKVLRHVEIIKSSRSGEPNFESHEVEANDLQLAVDQYFQLRGAARASRGTDARFGINKEANNSPAKVWLEKMRTLFIRKGSGFSSRSVITGDAYTKVNEIGIPLEVAQRITFEVMVNMHNITYLQDLVDNKLCLTFRDGSSTYSLREGSKGHTYLKPGQVVHRRIMNGDIVFINRPPTTHKHSLQALKVYIHDEHTVKINPLMCGPLSADFDGDCIHLFYPQSLAAKAEVLELFSVERQLLSSHSGSLNLQLATDSLLSLKMMFKSYFFNRAESQQLAMFVSSSLPWPALLKPQFTNAHWTALQILQTVLPACFDCCGERYLIKQSDMLWVDYDRDVISHLINDIATSIFFERGPKEVLMFFDSLQPLLMENLFSEGFSVGLNDFFISVPIRKLFQEKAVVMYDLLHNLRTTFNELVNLQLENHSRTIKVPVLNFILKSSALGYLIDSKSDSAINKVVQQIGFLGAQLSDRGKFYSKSLLDDVSSLFHSKYPSTSRADYPTAKYGMIGNCFFNGLDPFEEMVHSISTREVIVRSSRGLSEPGTLFKNLMAILRDVVICYDGTVRNVCSNFIIQFQYGIDVGRKASDLFPAGEPVGVLAATAMSTPAYKAVLDSTASSNSSWELMKEILLCKVSFKNDTADRRVMLYLNVCSCGRNYCREKAAYLVNNQLKPIHLKDVAVKFLIEYREHRTKFASSDIEAGLIGHVHLNEMMLEEMKITMDEILLKCKERITTFKKKKKGGNYFKRTTVDASECCSFHQSYPANNPGTPCLMFFWQDSHDIYLEDCADILTKIVCPVLLETVIKGDPRISAVTITWVSSDTTNWIKNPSSSEKGELALDVIVEKSAVKRTGDAWRIVLDSCLPVLHLIDTRRSIPHSVKQVQELMGISCAFDQAVQRLGKSVAMVAKGVHDDHLILLANSMTCTGNFVGFNPGGYKALSRSLNIQVPFTEATLFTPRKCFERAAEKRHLDSLSSIVGSCSWGKHVAVGTGSRFDVIWDRKEANFNEEDGTDVFNFLHMMRSTTAEEPSSGCLGVEVDDLELDYESEDFILSPDRHSGDKFVFEETVDIKNGLENEARESKWENVSTVKADSSSREWGGDINEGAPTTGTGWSNWGTKQAEKIGLSSRAQDVTSRSVGWDADIDKCKANDVDNFANEENKMEKLNAWSGWKVDIAESREKSYITTPEDSSRSSGWEVKASDRIENDTSNVKSNWGKNKGSDVLSVKAKKDTSMSNGWNANSSSWKEPEDANVFVSSKKGEEPRLELVIESRDWDKNTGQKKDSLAPSGWASSTVDNWTKDERPSQAINKVDSPVNDYSWEKQRSMEVTTNWWSENSTQRQKLQSKEGWFKNESTQPDNEPTSNLSQGWGSQDQLGSQQKPKLSHSESNHSWGNVKEWNQSESQQKSHVASDWGSQNESNCGHQKSSKVSQSWNSEILSTNSPNEQKSDETSQGWGFQCNPKLSQDESNHSWQCRNASEVSQSRNSQIESTNLTNEQKSEETSQGWGSQSKPKWSSGQNVSVRKQGWDSPIAEGGSSNERQRWGQGREPFKKNQFDGSRSGEWRSRKNLPPKSPGVGNDDSSISGLYTATRKRLDSFTTEEQDILADIEPVMLAIRRIMHQSGYNDGDPISADDQSYIVDNVFNYHPEKTVKMGTGIDHVMVNRHSTFQESRCLYIVGPNGRKEDFSYRKCLENFVKGKYPEIAETFIGKYFSKPKERRERSTTPDETEKEKTERNN